MLAGEPPAAWDHLTESPHSLRRCNEKKNGKKPHRKREEKIKKGKKRKKRKGVFLYESSLGEIRLMTSPFIRSRHALSKQINIWTE